MIVEHALLPVKPGREADFERAFATATALIAAMPGFRGLRLARGVEHPGTYLLLVEWETLGDHTEGFRGSAAYAQWRRLLHDFYDPFPAVEHFAPLLQVDPAPAGGSSGPGDPSARPGPAPLGGS